MPRQFLSRVFLVLALVFTGASVFAAPYAALVMDMRTGEVLYARNADTRLYPASLTKMMTLYITFEAIKNGEISLDTMVKISKNAAAEPPSHLGLRAGQRIKLRYLIRAAAVKSANDAATAIGEAVGGSEAAFARRKNKTAKALGMTRSTFRNANGLTLRGHLSTARDMTILGRHLFYDFPQYYNLFSRLKANAGGKEVRNTNRKFLRSYRGADGIKTGYTQAAGFNLVASAQHGQKRIIATVFGGRSTAMRNAKMAQLLDIGFKRAPTQVAVRKPPLPVYGRPKTVLVASAVNQSIRPRARPLRSRSEANKMMAAIGAAVKKADGEKQIVAVAASSGTTGGGVTRPAPRDDGLTVVTRVSTSGGGAWSVMIGALPTRNDAEKLLLRTALKDLQSLDGALRKVVPRGGRYQAHFVGLTRESALRACSRLNAWNQTCETIGPTG